MQRFQFSIIFARSNTCWQVQKIISYVWDGTDKESKLNFLGFQNNSYQVFLGIVTLYQIHLSVLIWTNAIIYDRLNGSIMCEVMHYIVGAFVCKIAEVAIRNVTPPLSLFVTCIQTLFSDQWLGNLPKHPLKQIDETNV